MVSINYAFKEIWCKIVFYGPGLSGKTTNLQYVHQKIPPQTKGELISLATDQDRTLFFDFLPVDIGKINGFSIKFQLYTVPGQVYYNATRRLVLRGVDGLVFVADSQRTKMPENIESYQDLLENLEGYEYDLDKLPLVFQYNKRDLSDVSSVEELESTLNPQGLPHFEAVAIQGRGVFDTLKCISKLVLDLAKGRKVVPESEVLVKEMTGDKSKPAPPQSMSDLEEAKTPASASLFPETLESLKEKGLEVIGQERLSSVLEEWSGSASPSGCQPGSPEEHLPPQPKTEYEPSIPEKREGFETQKEEKPSEGFIYGGEEKRVESGPPPPQAKESPTIISWSSARQKKGIKPKGFFLWRFLNKLIKR
jgi:signal recognition particle receptor subunit beta